MGHESLRQRLSCQLQDLGGVRLAKDRFGLGAFAVEASHFMDGDFHGFDVTVRTGLVLDSWQQAVLLGDVPWRLGRKDEHRDTRLSRRWTTMPDGELVCSAFVEEYSTALSYLESNCDDGGTAHTGMLSRCLEAVLSDLVVAVDDARELHQTAKPFAWLGRLDPDACFEGGTYCGDGCWEGALGEVSTVVVAGGEEGIVIPSKEEGPVGTLEPELKAHVVEVLFDWANHPGVNDLRQLATNLYESDEHRLMSAWKCREALLHDRPAREPGWLRFYGGDIPTVLLWPAQVGERSGDELRQELVRRSLAGIVDRFHCLADTDECLKTLSGRLVSLATGSTSENGSSKLGLSGVTLRRA